MERGWSSSGSVIMLFFCTAEVNAVHCGDSEERNEKERRFAEVDERARRLPCPLSPDDSVTMRGFEARCRAPNFKVNTGDWMRVLLCSLAWTGGEQVLAWNQCGCCF